MAKLTTSQRYALPKKSFAIRKKEPGPGSYPIENISHAINALARVHQFGSPAEIQQVTAAVHRKYPSLASVRQKGKI